MREHKESLFGRDLSTIWSDIFVNHFVGCLCQPFDIFHLFRLIGCLAHLCVIARSNWWQHNSSGENQTKKRERERKRGLQPRKMCQGTLNLAPPPSHIHHQHTTTITYTTTTNTTNTTYGSFSPGRGK